MNLAPPFKPRNLYVLSRFEIGKAAKSASLRSEGNVPTTVQDYFLNPHISQLLCNLLLSY
jgi:hypothetical protein